MTIRMVIMMRKVIRSFLLQIVRCLWQQFFKYFFGKRYFSYEYGGGLRKQFSQIFLWKKRYFSKYIFSYDYGGDYGGFFGSGFPSLFGAPRVHVVVVPVEEVLTCADSDDDGDGGGRDHGLNF